MCFRVASEESDGSLSDCASVPKRQWSSLLESKDLTESDSDFQMLKVSMASQNYLPTQLFNPPVLESNDTSYNSGSDLDITNAQSCKFGKVVLEHSEGGTGNFTSMTTVTPQNATDSAAPLVQPPITHHFRSVKSSSQAENAGPQEHIGTYSLVHSSLALLNL